MLSLAPLKVMALTVLGLTFGGASYAAVQCPPVSGGQPLRQSGGGTLYEGPVQDNAALAPSNTRQGPGGWVNTWRFVSVPDVTLVCRYGGSQPSLALPLTREVRSCQQDARSFICQ